MNPEDMDMEAVKAVACATKAAIALAAMAGLDVLSAPSIRLDFDPSGDVTVALLVDGEEMDAGVVAAADIETFLAEHEAKEEKAEGEEPEAPEAEEPPAQ